MSNISEVIYKDIDPETCSVMEASEYHYHNNLLGVHEMFEKEYEEYELKQARMRNKAIRDAVNERGMNEHPKMETMIFGVSSLRERVVVITEV